MSQKQAVTSVEDIERKAIDSFGILGSFYNGHRDQIVKRDYINSGMQSSELPQAPYCIIETGDVNGTLNLLRSIGIQGDLRLNLLLNITKRVGIAAILNYSRRINEYTRFLYYSRVTRNEQTTVTAEQAPKSMESFNPNFNVTHIITAIDFGIEFVSVFQLPHEVDLVRQIDGILHKIRHGLLNDKDRTLVLTNDEERVLEKLIHMTTYSNISSLMAITRVSDMLSQIDRTKTRLNQCHPLTYYLRPIEWFNLPSRSTEMTFKVLPQEWCDQIEQYILQLRTPIRYLEASLDHHMPKYLHGHLQERIDHARQQCSTLQNMYTTTISQLTELLIVARNDRFDLSIICQELHSNEQINALKNSIDQLLKDLADLEHALKDEDDLRQPHVISNKALESHVDEDDMTNQYNTNSVSDIPSDYDADSSDTTFSSDEPTILATNDMDDLENDIEQRAFSPVIVTEHSFDQQQTLPTSNEVINILLLGEIGVGKSTFINALLNYLNFNRFDQAQSTKPVVIIPTSFTMTVGENFDEQVVQSDGFDHSNNEDFDHLGQSVTQHCQTYLFHLNDGAKLCLIDTPGFGDTRGVNQDHLHMESILKYISNLTHLNAICFLLKPNISRLNIFFRSCLTQLVDFLGMNLWENLIFCFTHTRSTLDDPGDTVPLLRSILESFPFADIPLTNENTFYFDSESFRYLIARADGILFNDADKYEYEISWSTSAKESHRLIDYIRTKLIAYPLDNGQQSIKHAQFQIDHLIRPLLETLRNTLRNITLWNIESPNQSIELYPIVIDHPVYLCLSCNPKIIKMGNFGIIADMPHELHHTCVTCRCSPNRHIPVEYLLSYKVLNRPSKTPISEMKDQLVILRDACAEFAYFLVNIACCTKENPILIHLMRMIEQETTICRRSQPDYLNVQLIKELMQWKQKYQERINELISQKKRYDHLSVVYRWIEKMKDISIINEQLRIIKQGEDIMMKEHEFQPI